MSLFDESICDCCVCPMQCVMEQLVGEEIGIVTASGSNIFVILNEVKNFIAFTDQGNFPICNITTLQTDGATSLNLKPIRKSKGECACCEDPMTNLAKSMIREIVNIEIIGNVGLSADAIIVDVGEGIILIGNPAGSELAPVSSCFTTRIIPVASSVSLSERTFKFLEQRT
ncbi:hypothetical protein [Chengkuizengella axinellae]|uniref:Uncharacterized protein n=1 Tax=Chengkuizengella axinellae TaxID=3064388 RepID=A0ABT9J419_9BACL|nr:hypothetical protein [Chengkuizengella sp. 2205SS18-9]MDP5276339.1 hypothetical protein [Chengkuizengella sp. 2205SS18-9]